MKRTISETSKPAGRPFGILDVLVMIAATAVGLAWIRVVAPTLTLEMIWEAILARPNGEFPGVVVDLAGVIVVPMLAAWSLALLLLGRRDAGTRPRRRRRGPAPGTLACLAAAAMLGLPLAVVLVIGAVAGSAALEPHQEVLAIGSLVGALLAGIAIFWSWITLALCRRWQPQPTWLDRAGRLIGMTWMLLAMTSVVATVWMMH